MSRGCDEGRAGPGPVRQHAASQTDRAVLGDVTDRMLCGPRRAPESYFHSGLAGLDVEIAGRAEHVAPIPGGEDQMVERAGCVEEDGDRTLVPHIHGLAPGAPTELIGRRFDPRSLARAHQHLGAGFNRRSRHGKADARGPTDHHHLCTVQLRHNAVSLCDGTKLSPVTVRKKVGAYTGIRTTWRKGPTTR